MRCPRCGLQMERGQCKTCGYSDPDYEPSSSSDFTNIDIIKHLATGVAIVIFLALLVFNTALTIISVEIVLPQTLTESGIIFVLIPVPFGLIEITGISFSVYYIFLFAAIIASFTAFLYSGFNDLYLYFKEILTGKFDELKKKDRLDSPILRLFTIFAALLFISLTYQFGLELIGISPEEAHIGDYLWVQIYSLTQAVVWEEIVTRVVFIGVPMAIYAGLKGDKGWKKYFLGGFGFKYRAAVTWILISSVIFALAHLPSWDLFKMFPTFIAGLAFGYLFVKDGLHSAILLHFFWNFMTFPDMMLELDNYPFYFSMITLFWMMIGVYYTYHYVKKVGNWLDGQKGKEQKKETEYISEGDTQSRTAGVTAGYICPNCSYEKALYTKEGKLRCKRCGRESDPKSDQMQNSAVKVSRDQEWPPS